MHAEDIYFEQFRKWAFSFPPPWIYPVPLMVSHWVTKLCITHCEMAEGKWVSDVSECVNE